MKSGCTSPRPTPRPRRSAGAMFDVLIEGQTVLDNYDVYAEVGGYKGVVKTFTVNADNNLDVDFLRGVQNPSVKGIEIIRRLITPRGAAGRGPKDARRHRPPLACATIAPSALLTKAIASPELSSGEMISTPIANSGDTLQASVAREFETLASTGEANQAGCSPLAVRTTQLGDFSTSRIAWRRRHRPDDRNRDWRHAPVSQ